MVTKGNTHEVETNEVSSMEEDENGNIVRVKKTTQSIRPNERLKAMEMLMKLKGWGNDVNDSELSKVDTLLQEMKASVDDD